jgi:hypothetical protein
MELSGMTLLTQQIHFAQIVMLLAQPVLQHLRPNAQLVLQASTLTKRLAVPVLKIAENVMVLYYLSVMKLLMDTS